MNLFEWYHYLNTELADPRTNDWLLLSSPFPVLLITCAYLYFVLHYGPNYMKDRRPYSFKTFIKCYNVFQIVTNSLVVYHIFEAGWYRDYFIYCRKPDYSYNYGPYKLARLSRYLLMLKLIDYIETIVFVLRKKQRQVSFLHVYHHVSTALISWLFSKYFTTGMMMTYPLLNCIVHVIMYTYYLLASQGQKVQRILNPIKPMITTIQMVQFWILILYATTVFYPGCPGEEVVAGVMIADLLYNFFLFYRFYQESYRKKK